MRARVFALAALTGALAACGLAACGLAPDVGPRLAGTCSNTDSNPDVSVSFSNDIRPLFSRPPGGPSCGCHLPSANGSSTGIQLSGLNLSSLTTLRAGGFSSGSRIVIPMQPCDSVLYQKIDEAPPFGSRMPLNGPPFLSPEEIELVSDWIAEGAADN